jgi:hypothetical protein
MNNFIVAVQNQLNFNKVLETRIAQLAAALPHPNGRDFPSQPAIPIKENVKAMITRSGKTMAEPKVKSKKMSPTNPVEEEEKVEAEVEAEPRPKRKKTLVRLHSKTSEIHSYYHSPIKERSLWKMKNSAASWE